ncbi:Flagellar hook-associated protein 1 [compost metagenome]
MVSSVGNQTASAKVSVTSQNNIVKQLTIQQQSASGVNLDEEYGELLRFQQYYMANAQVIQTASSMFDALLNIR